MKEEVNKSATDEEAYWISPEYRKIYTMSQLENEGVKKIV